MREHDQGRYERVRAALVGRTIESVGMLQTEDEIGRSIDTHYGQHEVWTLGFTDGTQVQLETTDGESYMSALGMRGDWDDDDA